MFYRNLLLIFKFFASPKFLRLYLIGFIAGFISFIYKGPRITRLSLNALREHKVCGLPDQEKNTGPIFFVDVTASSCLTINRACSIESAARANPNFDVVVYVDNDKLSELDIDKRLLFKKSQKGCQNSAKLAKLYKNLKFKKISAKDTISSSSFKSASDKLLKSFWRPVHAKRILSWIYLAEHGGVYLDSSFIITKPLECLGDSLALEAHEISSQIMSFRKGSVFTRYFLNNARLTYQAQDWTALGDPAITFSTKLYCGIDDLVKGRHKCHKGFQLDLLHSEAFFPIGKHQRVLLHQDLKHINVDFSNSYGVNFLLPDWSPEPGESSLLSALMEEFCPVTFNSAQLYDLK